MEKDPPLSRTLLGIGEYASKALSRKAKDYPNIANLSIGEPEFGPPDFVREELNEALSWNGFVAASKQYEQQRGMPGLREAIASYYKKRYGLIFDPDREVIVTHGGVEAIALAILAVSDPGDGIIVTDPSYMLYERAIVTLGRKPITVEREPATDEYCAMIEAHRKTLPTAARAIIVNSPENPTGYMLSGNDLSTLAAFATERNLWLIHDEVYDVMAFDRAHLPARAQQGLEGRSILVNSFSKKFGVPGLRIGWLCGPPAFIDLAAKLHDYLYLGINMLAERAALAMLTHPGTGDWLNTAVERIGARVRRMATALPAELGFQWDRSPSGGMFAFPRVDRLTARLGETSCSPGEVFAYHLLHEAKVAVIPGSVYGRSGTNSIRLVLCSGSKTFDLAMERMRSAAERLI